MTDGPYSTCFFPHRHLVVHCTVIGLDIGAKYKVNKCNIFTGKRDPEDIQRQYYTETSSLYDEMHGSKDYEHYVALNYVASFMDLLGISSVLDVGSGTGRAVKYLFEKGVKVQGIEPVIALTNQAIQKNGIAAESLVCGIGEHLPFADNSYDAVCEFGILHHVQDPNAVVEEMIRVARKVIFLSDSNRFGQGSKPSRWIKLLLYKMNLWGVADLIKTRGRGYTISEVEGVAYSYSVFDSIDLLAGWANRIILIPTRKEEFISWLHPLLTASHILPCAIREGSDVVDHSD